MNAELAWLAGIYEGEGTAYVHRCPKCSWARVVIAMKDEDIIVRCQRIAGVGRVTRDGRNGLWRFTVSGSTACADFLRRLWPLLGERRRTQAQALLNFAAERPTADLRRTKLTDDDVDAIRQRSADGATTQALALEYAVEGYTIRRILRRRTWARQ